jgi:hypothetical protein
VLVIVLITQFWPLLALQTILFAISGFGKLRWGPYGWIYRTFVAPRLKPSAEREDTPPLKFAQQVGFTFGLIGTIGFVAGLTTLGVVASVFALIAAFLNAAFGLCLGCEMYLLIQRFKSRAV